MNDQSSSLQAWVANGTLTQEDADILPHIPRCDRLGRELKNWWDDIYARDAFTNKFQLFKQFNRPDYSFGYLETADLPSGRYPVMGEYQDLFFDTIKSIPLEPAERRSAEWMNEQIRAFALRYFLRVTSSRATDAFPEQGDPLPGLHWLSQCPDATDRRRDIGFYQLYGKRKDTGALEVFAPADQPVVVDVRQLGTDYDWVLLKARLFDFKLTTKGPAIEGYRFPLTVTDTKEYLYGLLTPCFNLDRQNPEKGVLGEYGMGFSLVAPAPGRSALTIGPEVFTLGMNYFRFKVLESGSVRLRITFSSNQLNGILPLPVSPINWGLNFANLATFGFAQKLLGPIEKQAANLPLGKLRIDPFFTAIKCLNLVTGNAAKRDYCISTETVFKFILRKHGIVFNHLTSDSVRVFRLIHDWLDEAKLPRWVVRGEKP